MPQRPLEARHAIGPARAHQPDAALRVAIRLRETQPDEVAGVVALVNAAYHPRDHWISDQPRTSDAGFLRETGQPRAQSIVAELDGTIVGHVVLWLRDDAGWEGAWIGMLATAVTQQGRGIGTLLIEEAERRARAAGYSVMRLDCVGENGMPPYYASLGFEIEREERGHLRGAKAEWTLVYMAKRISDE